MRRTLEISLLAVLMGAVLTFAWVGFLSSDDLGYLSGARGWLTSFPYVGANHWEIRQPFVMLMAAIIGIFGESEFTTVLATILYFVAVVIFTYGYLNKLFPDRGTAVITAGLLILTPLFAVQSTTASVDIPELFFVALSVWLFYLGTLAEKRLVLLLACGVLAGLAFVTREIASALVIFYAVLFLWGAYMPRRYYWLIAAGWGAVVLADYIYFLIMTGDFLYRFSMVFLSRFGQGSSTGPNFDPGAGNVINNFFLGPIFALLVNQEFGLLFFLAVPAVWSLWRSPTLEPAQRRLVGILFVLAAVWFLSVGYLMGNRPLPRYFSVTTYAAVVIVGIWLSQVLSRRRLWPSALVAGLLVSTNMLAIAVENRDPMFGERALARFVVETNSVVYTDPRTAWKAAQFVEWQGVEMKKRVKAAPPPSGSLYFYYSKDVSAGFINNRTFDTKLYRPKPEWREVWRATPSPKFTKFVVDFLGIGRFIPGKILSKLVTSNPPAIVYRTR